LGIINKPFGATLGWLSKMFAHYNAFRSFRKGKKLRHPNTNETKQHRQMCSIWNTDQSIKLGDLRQLTKTINKIIQFLGSMSCNYKRIVKVTVLTDIATCQKRNVCKSWKSVACANVM
jgi:hypothetical protein